jgi:transketolase
MSSLRNSFASTMVKIGKQDEKVIVLVGDISHGILGEFRKENPERYFNIGICEPGMVGVAAGLSMIGLRPIVHTIAPFLIERSFEQIKLDFGYQSIPGNFISVGSSFDYAKLGCSHHSYNDVSLMSSLDANVVLPGSAIEFEKLFEANYSSNIINYWRLTENAHGVDLAANEIVIGKAIRIKSGEKVTLAALGPSLRSANETAQILMAKGIDVDLIYFHTFKPFDVDLLRESIVKTRFLVTVDELSIVGGFHDLCLRNLAGNFEFKSHAFTIRDFVRGYGTHQELLDRAKISTKFQVAKILEEFEK